MSTQIVIRSRQRGAYFSESAKWSHTLAQARSFASVLEAGRFCEKERLCDVDIVVLRSDRPPMRVPLPSNGNGDISLSPAPEPTQPSANASK